MALSDSLTRRVGPLPAYAWGIVGVGAFYGYRWWVGRNAVADEPPTEVPSDNFAGSGITGEDVPPSDIGPPVPTSPGSPPVTNNTAWSRLVFNELVADGKSPSLVSTAVSKYLSGQPLSDAEQAVIDLALSRFGSPPEGVIPVLNTPSPPFTVKPGAAGHSIWRKGWSYGKFLANINGPGDPATRLAYGVRLAAANPSLTPYIIGAAVPKTDVQVSVVF